MRDLIAPVNDPDSEILISAERKVNALLNGGCHAPVAVFAEHLTDQPEVKIRLRAVVGELDGSNLLKSERIGAHQFSEALAEEVADDLISQGASVILQRYNDD